MLDIWILPDHNWPGTFRSALNADAQALALIFDDSHKSLLRIPSGPSGCGIGAGLATHQIGHNETIAQWGKHQGRLLQCHIHSMPFTMVYKDFKLGGTQGRNHSN
jgi:hypothetical protein